MRWPLMGLVAGLSMLQCVPSYEVGDGGFDGGPPGEAGEDAGKEAPGSECGVLEVNAGVARAPSKPALNPAGSFTVEGWFYPTAFPTQFQNLISHFGDTGEGTGSWGLYLNTGKPNFAISCTGTDQWIVESGTALQLNQWTHVAGILEADTQKLVLYVNGLRTEFTPPQPCSKAHAADLPLNISFDTQDRFVGLIDEVRVSSEKRYDGPKISPAKSFAKDASTLALFHFDEVGQKTALDASDHANPAVLMGTADMISRCR